MLNAARTVSIPNAAVVASAIVAATIAGVDDPDCDFGLALHIAAHAELSQARTDIEGHIVDADRKYHAYVSATDGGGVSVETGLAAARGTLYAEPLKKAADDLRVRLMLVRKSQEQAGRAVDKARALCAAAFGRTQKAAFLALANRKLGLLLATDAVLDDERALQAQAARAGHEYAFPALTDLVGRTDDTSGSPSYYAAKELRQVIMRLEA